jgi:5'-methylthioadenosine nucleosidase
VSTSVVHHDRRIPLPAFDKYGLGRRDTWPCKAMATQLGLKSGVVTSGACMVATEPCAGLLLAYTLTHAALRKLH